MTNPTPQPPAPTPNVSETPRTDGKVLTWNLSERELRERQPNQLGYNGTSINGKVVLADFARQLERELAAVTKERDDGVKQLALNDQAYLMLSDEHVAFAKQLTAALARAEKAKEDTRRLDRIISTEADLHCDREGNWTIWAYGRAYESKKHLRRAIDAALAPTKGPTP